MLGRFIALLIAASIVTAGATTPRTRVDRLVGGHLTNDDDAELLEADASGSGKGAGRKALAQGDGADADRKTLSQQVADGKYGLIQKEIFAKPLKRPGLVSYDPNPEIPKDTIHNLGGLTKDDIWLAENHLLVLKGGTYPKHEDKIEHHDQIWPAIDDYKAPKRPVKLPLHPKVPPPFPVQLVDDGPLQILGTNFTRTLNGTLDASLYPLPPPEGWIPGTGPFFPPYRPDTPNASPGGAAQPNPQQLAPPFLNGTPPHFFASLPPGAVAVPPPPPPGINDFDEEDPSIYYPPPYSFFYPNDNRSFVKAGPLVPGIILPPPPDFFAPLQEPSRVTTTKKPKTHSTTMIPQLIPTTTPLTPTTFAHEEKTVTVLPVHPPYEINNELKPLVTTQKPVKYTKPPYKTYSRSKSRTRIPSRNQGVTILRPVKPVQKDSYYNKVNNKERGKPFEIYGPPIITTTPRTIVSSTKVPLKHYVRLQEPEVITVVPEKVPEKSKKAQYYYYEEEPQPNSITTKRPPADIQNFFNLPDKFYENPKHINSPVQYNTPKYVYVTPNAYITPRPKYRFVQQTPRTNTYNLHLANLKKHIEYYTSPKPIFREISSAKPVYQYSFQANNYNQPEQDHQNEFKPSPSDDDDNDRFRPMPKYSVQIQPAIEIHPTEPPVPQSQNPIYYTQNYRTNTETPRYYNRNEGRYNYERPERTTSAPLNQYSYQATPSSVRYTNGPQSTRYYRPRPEENYYEDMVNSNFGNFGQRLQPATTPRPRAEYTTRTPKVIYVTANNQQVTSRYQRPVSLHRDTLINYQNPRPPIEPQSEQVHINKPVNYPQIAKYLPKPADQYRNRDVRPERPQIVKAIPVPVDDSEQSSFISYQLPGDNGAHFYFLTPQLAQRREQGAPFYFSQRDSERIRRRNIENKR